MVKFKLSHNFINNFKFTETSTKTASSTVTENFKFNANHIILESDIDLKEWRREIDRVQKLLEISEHPEFLITSSNYSDFSSTNFNKFLNNNNEDVISKIGIFTTFLNRSTSNNINFELLKNCSHKIENELNSIKNFEKIISLKDRLKNQLKNVNEVSILLNNRKDEVNQFEYRVNNLENIYDQTIDRIRDNNEKEEILTNIDNSNSENKIKKRIYDLKVFIYIILFLFYLFTFKIF